MIRRIMSVALAALLVAPAFAPAQEKSSEENPFKKAKVGDYVVYTMTTSFMNMKIEGTTKMTVSAKDDKTATLSVSGEVNGMKIPEQKTEIDLTKPYDPTAASGVAKGADVKVEKVKDGSEKIKVGGKEYDCKWQSMKVSASAMGIKIDSEVKYWLSKDAPLGGMVKMEMKSQFADVVMELKESGSK